MFKFFFLLCATALTTAMPVEPGAQTRTAPKDMPRPQADLSELDWLVGTWEGPGIEGGAATEVYSSAAGGQIVGHFRQLAPDGSVLFYELIAVTQNEGSLEYRLKHFNADLSGWEDKTLVRIFPLVAKERDTWFFNGLTIRREAADRMTAIVRIAHDDGSTEELTFRYRKTG